MRRITLAIVLSALLAALLASCSLFVTPVAYTRFETTGSQYVHYSSDEYGLLEGQIMVFKDEEEFSKGDEAIADLDFRFTDCFGKGDLGGELFTVVNLKRASSDLTVYILKDSPAYSEEKRLFLNGTELVPDYSDDLENLRVFTFNSINRRLVRTNSFGKLDEDSVNVLEYR